MAKSHLAIGWATRGIVAFWGLALAGTSPFAYAQSIYFSSFNAGAGLPYGPNTLYYVDVDTGSIATTAFPQADFSFFENNINGLPQQQYNPESGNYEPTSYANTFYYAVSTHNVGTGTTIDDNIARTLYPAESAFTYWFTGPGFFGFTTMGYLGGDFVVGQTGYIACQRANGDFGWFGILPSSNTTGTILGYAFRAGGLSIASGSTLEPTAPLVTIPSSRSAVLDVGDHQTLTLKTSASTGAIDATFASTTGGIFTVTHAIETFANVADPANPYGAGTPTFVLPAGVVQIWDLVFSDGSFTGPVQLVFHYDPTGLTLQEELALHIFHYTNDQWTVLPGTVDPDLDTIAITTDSFSPFALGRLAVPEPASLSLLALGTLTILSRHRRRHLCLVRPAFPARDPILSPSPPLTTSMSPVPTASCGSTTCWATS